MKTPPEGLITNLHVLEIVTSDPLKPVENRRVFRIMLKFVCIISPSSVIDFEKKLRKGSGYE